jgi:hypothetical protein
MIFKNICYLLYVSFLTLFLNLFIILLLIIVTEWYISLNSKLKMKFNLCHRRCKMTISVGLINNNFHLPRFFFFFVVAGVRTPDLPYFMRCPYQFESTYHFKKYYLNYYEINQNYDSPKNYFN